MKMEVRFEDNVTVPQHISIHILSILTLSNIVSETYQIGQVIQTLASPMDGRVLVLGLCSQNQVYADDVIHIRSHARDVTVQGRVCDDADGLKSDPSFQPPFFPVYDLTKSPSPPLTKGVAIAKIIGDEMGLSTIPQGDIAVDTAVSIKRQKEAQRMEKLRQMEAKVKAFKERKAS